MRFCRFLMGILFFSSAVFSTNLSIHPSKLPVGLCGSSDLSHFNFQAYFSELQKRDPQAADSLLQISREMQQFNKAAITQKQFWAFNLKSRKFYRVTATLRKEGNLTRIWVEDSSWVKQYVTMAEVETIYEFLEEHTGEKSIQPSRGIIEIDTLLFGTPPNKDGDGITDFLILDIKDSYDPNKNGSSFVAGFFFPNDQSDATTSNKMDLLYLDSYPGIFFNNQRSTNRVLSTTAHEFQHLIHYHYDKDEETWVNEGLSELASTYCGFGLDFPYLFLQDPNQTLTAWGGKVKDYARVGLWTLYVAEQFGINFIKRYTQSKANGITSFNQVLQETGNADLDFQDVFVNWVLANYINDVDINPRYGYQLSDTRGLKALPAAHIMQFPKNESGVVKKYAAEYFRFNGADTLTVNFEGIPPLPYFIHRNTTTQVQPLLPGTFVYPGFNANDEFVLVLINLNPDKQFKFSAYAPFSVEFLEISYGDGKFDFGIRLKGIGANKFTITRPNLKLIGTRIFSSQANTPVKIHVFAADNNGLPGADLMTPIDTTLFAERSWSEFEFDNPLPDLNPGESFFIGVELANEDYSLAYDHNTSGSGKSFLFRNGTWNPLSNFQTTNGKTLTGNWMITALLQGGLVPSGQPTPPPQLIPSPIALQIIPSPQRPGITPIAKITLRNAGLVKIEIYNVLGEKLLQTTQNFDFGGTYFIPLNLPHFPLISGVYFYRATLLDRNSGKKLNSKPGKIIIIN